VCPRPQITHRPTAYYPRTRADACLAFPDVDDGAVEPGRLTLLDITSGLPHDSRAADERAAARQLRDLRAHVTAARAMVASHSDMAETLARNRRKATWFYARFGITEATFRYGVPVQLM